MSTTAGTGLDEYEDEFSGKHHLVDDSNGAVVGTTPATDPAEHGGPMRPRDGMPQSRVSTLTTEPVKEDGPLHPRDGMPQSRVSEPTVDPVEEGGPLHPRDGMPQSRVVSGQPES